MLRLRRRWVRYTGLPAEERRLLPVAFLMLAVARAGARLAGVQRTRRLIGRLSLRWSVEPDRVAELVRMACVALPGATSCLPRALVLEGLLRAANHSAELRIGVAPRKGRERLPAHAWVEVDGVPVAEDISPYTPLPVFGTSG